MMMRRAMGLLGVAMALALFGADAAATRPAVQLFNRKDLTGWEWHSMVPGSKISDTWSVQEGALRSGVKPVGFIATEKVYKNFVLTVEYRHITPLNGGIYICTDAEIGGTKSWPDGLQIQGKFGAVGDLLNQNTGMKAMKSDPARTKTVNRDVVVSRLADAVEKPLKEWNTLVMEMKEGTLSVMLNGKLANRAEGIEPASGKIGIQSEGAEMEFRKVELVPLD
jgi:hypothetical protein